MIFHVYFTRLAPGFRLECRLQPGRCDLPWAEILQEAAETALAEDCRFFFVQPNPDRLGRYRMKARATQRSGLLDARDFVRE